MVGHIIDSVSFGGVLGERLEANLSQWLIPAPQANPGMSEMFRMRDALPRPRLVPWYGEFPGKYITAASTAYAISKSAALRSAVDALISRLAKAQDEKGYLSPHPTKEGLTGHTIGYEDNALMLNLWNLWGCYHLMFGLISWYDNAGNEEAYALAIRMADYIARAFLDGKSSFEGDFAPENFGLAHIYAILYQRTGNALYRDMAALISDAADRRTWLISGIADEKLAYYQLPWTRWEGLHFSQSLAERSHYEGDERLLKAFWGTVRSIVLHDRHNNGGFSSGEKAKGDPYSPEPIETCCTIAWMSLLTDAYKLSKDSRWIDELELSLLNSVLGAQHPSGRWWTYNTPMDGLRCASAHTLVFQAREGSPELNCCSVNGPRGLSMTAEWGLGIWDNTIDINYYGPCEWRVTSAAGQNIHIKQETQYPAGNRVVLTVSSGQPAELKLRLRIPGWSCNTKALVDGNPVTAHAGSYLEIARNPEKPVRIELEFDFTLSAWIGQNSSKGKTSLYRGPLLLAWDQRYNGVSPDEIPLINASQLNDIPKPSWLPPMILMRDDHSGAVLCDFASAGCTGTLYRSWLPIASSHRMSIWGDC